MNTKRTDKEVLSPLARLAELLIVAAMLALLGFLLYHQSSDSGFLTAKFGTLEMICLYGPIVLSLAAPMAWAATGRRNPARPYEAATNLLLALGSLWLLIVFPFSFAHLADTLPSGLRFILAWVTDDIGKIPLILQVISGPVVAIVNLWRYNSVRRSTFRNMAAA